MQTRTVEPQEGFQNGGSRSHAGQELRGVAENKRLVDSLSAQSGLPRGLPPGLTRRLLSSAGPAGVPRLTLCRAPDLRVQGTGLSVPPQRQLPSLFGSPCSFFSL